MRSVLSRLTALPLRASQISVGQAHRSLVRVFASETGDLLADPKKMEAGLYLVATPIGNLDDITLRALKVLRAADTVFAEDTRHTVKLLRHYDISPPSLLSYHEHNTKQRENDVLQRLRDGQIVALVSDAGTPAVSDPGADIVAAAVKENLRVIPIPGPSAALAALVASGLPTEHFYFFGFLQPKSTQRQEQLASIPINGMEQTTVIFYTPPHGLRATLEDLEAVWGGSRRMVVSRELTKLHEEFFRGTVSEALAEFTQREPRGEIVLLVEGGPVAGSGRGEGGAQAGPRTADDPEVTARVEALLASGMRLSEVAKTVSVELKVNRKELYTRLLDLQVEKGPASAGSGGGKKGGKNSR